MLFGYRGGKNRITPKVWLKLARAEREAGIISVERVQDEENADHSVNPKQAGVGESAHVVREKLLRERKEEGAGDGHRPPLQEGLEARVARLETALQAIQEALKNL